MFQPSDFQNLSPVGLVYSMLKADNAEISDRAATAAASELVRILTETNPAALKQIAKELSNKKTFKGILKKLYSQRFRIYCKSANQPTNNSC